MKEKNAKEHKGNADPTAGSSPTGPSRPKETLSLTRAAVLRSWDTKVDGALLSGAVTLVRLSMNKQEDPSCKEGK